MKKLDILVQDFLTQKKIAVVGDSDKGDSGCNLSYTKLRGSGYQVNGVNPRLSKYDGAPGYPELKSTSEEPDAVFILTNPAITDQIVEQCIDLGVKHVWMYGMLRTKPGLAPSMSSASKEAVEKCRASGIAIIAGSCPNQFLKPDLGHRVMRGIWSPFGCLSVN